MNEFVAIELKESTRGTYKETQRITDPEQIYRDLTHDLIASKLHKADYIKSIRDKCNYDGTRTITITYNNNVRRIYQIRF